MVLMVHSNLLIAADQPLLRQGGLIIRYAPNRVLYLFFVLSGYFIGAPYIRALLAGDALPNAGRYARRRIARILPAYWIALVALLLLVRPAGATWVSVMAHAAMVHSEIPGLAMQLYPIAWTLGVEAVFYVMVPLVAAAIARAYRRPVPARHLMIMVLAVWAGSTCVTLMGTQLGLTKSWPGLFDRTLLGTIGYFWPGFIVAIVRFRWPGLVQAPDARGTSAGPRRVPWGPALLILGTVIWITSALVSLAPSAQFHPDMLAGETVAQMGTVATGALLAVAVFTPATLGLASRLLAPLGLVSYGLYLWHWIVIQVLLRAGFHLHANGNEVLTWLASCVLVLCLTLPIATASWFLVERPMTRLAARGIPFRRVRPVAEVVA
jgi:peptidoglycan/LPS O-acetylase OafA/YrhL